MRVIMISTCFECPFCSPGMYVKDGQTYNSYKCRKTGRIVDNARIEIDPFCELEIFDEEEFNLLTMIEQSYLDIKTEIETTEEGEDLGNDRIIYEFFNDSFGFLDKYGD